MKLVINNIDHIIQELENGKHRHLISGKSNVKLVRFLQKGKKQLSNKKWWWFGTYGKKIDKAIRIIDLNNNPFSTGSIIFKTLLCVLKNEYTKTYQRYIGGNR